VICFDEISLHTGHGKYVLVISAPELGLVLDVLPDRNKETLENGWKNVAKPGVKPSKSPVLTCGMLIKRWRLTNCPIPDAS